MTRFEHAMEDCLIRHAEGESLEDCIGHYPEFAEKLRAPLLAADLLKKNSIVQPSPVFKTMARNKLVAHMQSHPHHRNVPFSLRYRSAWQMAAATLGFVLVFLVTGTAFAQSAMPGNLLYGWKLTSESVWSAVSFDPIGVDLALAQRRVHEMQSVSLSNREISMQNYLGILERLESQANPGDQYRISLVLNDLNYLLIQSGILVQDQDFPQPDSSNLPLSPTMTQEVPLLPADHLWHTPNVFKTPESILPFELLLITPLPFVNTPAP